MKSEEKKDTQKMNTEQNNNQEPKNNQEKNQDNQQDTAQQEDKQTSQQQEADDNPEAQTSDEKVSEEKDQKKGKKEKGKESRKTKPEEKSDKEKLAELQDRYLRLQAEYDNYRKRTLREKMELTRSAGEDLLKGLLPVMDDFERALQAIDEAENAESFKDGVHLIYNKFREFFKQQGVKEMESQDKEFDTDKHEAISKVPAPSEDMKGKVVDVVQTGYYLNDKVLRYAKVVVGE